MGKMISECEANSCSISNAVREITGRCQVWTVVPGLGREHARGFPFAVLAPLNMTYVMPLLSKSQTNQIKREPERRRESKKDSKLSQLEIKDLHASIEGKEILKGVDFQVKQGEIQAIMGPNGSGKSTLASTIMGHPKYKVTKGDISFDGQTLLNLAPDARARKGV